jgi:hypothetical protein
LRSSAPREHLAQPAISVTRPTHSGNHAGRTARDTDRALSNGQMKLAATGTGTPVVAFFCGVIDAPT